MVCSPSLEPSGSISYRSTSPLEEVVCPLVGSKHQLPLFMDSDDKSSEDERTPKKVKFPEVPCKISYIFILSIIYIFLHILLNG